MISSMVFPVVWSAFEIPNSAQAFSKKGVTEDVFPAQYAAFTFFFILSGRFRFKSSCID